MPNRWDTFRSGAREVRDKLVPWVVGGILIAVPILWLVGHFVEDVREELSERQLLTALLIVVFGFFFFYGPPEPEGAGMRVNESQDSDNEHFIKAIETLRPREARLLEFSSRTADGILTALMRENCQISLLVKHPGSVGEFQRDRIFDRLRDLHGIKLAGYPRCTVRCYTPNASLRGRKLDDRLVNMGWYTPTEQRIRLGEEDKPLEVFGHSNPLITADLRSAEGRYLATAFDRTFDELWSHKLTEDYADVLKGKQQ